MDERQQLKAMPRKDKRYLSNRMCAWCCMPLNLAGCGAIYEPCSEETRIKRRQKCLAERKPRKQNENH